MTCSDSYLVGEGITIQGTFRLKPVAPATVGALVDPTTVTAYIKGAGVTTQLSFVYLTDAEVVRVSEGIYQLTHTLTEAGQFEWLWQGVGNGVISVAVGKARVKSIPFTLDP